MKETSKINNKIPISAVCSELSVFSFPACSRAQSYAERLRLGLAVIHGEAQCSESDMADGRHSPPCVRNTTGHTGLELPCKNRPLCFAFFVLLWLYLHVKSNAWHILPEHVCVTFHCFLLLD